MKKVKGMFEMENIKAKIVLGNLRGPSQKTWGEGGGGGGGVGGGGGQEQNEMKEG